MKKALPQYQVRRPISCRATCRLASPAQGPKLTCCMLAVEWTVSVMHLCRICLTSRWRTGILGQGAALDFVLAK